MKWSAITAAPNRSRACPTAGRLKRALAVIAVIAVSGNGRAQELEPRAYSSVPVGMIFLISGYGYTAGNVVTDPALPLEDAEIEAHAAFVGYARSLDVFGRSGK